MQRPFVFLPIALAAACAHTVPTTSAATCPTVATTWVARPWPTTKSPPKFPCVRATPTPGAEHLRHGKDLDEALHCVDQYYTGPDGLPLDAMLKASLDSLVHGYPDLVISADSSGAVVISPKASTDPQMSLTIASPTDAQRLTETLVRVAVFARMALPSETIVAPDDLLLRGALSALAWQTDVLRKPFPGPEPSESFTAATPDHLVDVKVGTFVHGVASRLRHELAWQTVRGVILDLRGSSGGLFTEAPAIADLFMRDGCLVATRPHQQLGRASAQPQGGDIDAPLVVLIDHKTSEGAELVAATLRGRGRALLVGEKSFGRGLLQSIVPLSSGAFLRITIGELLAGDGTPFHDRGVEPDVGVPAAFDAAGRPDRALAFATEILRHTAGAQRGELSKAALDLATR